MTTLAKSGDRLRLMAPAKINLTLHVTGRRAGGYHDLDSLVAFAGIGDTITARASTDLSLTVGGPFAEGVPADSRNLIMRAAAALREKHGIETGAALTLEKELPHAAGIGSGSSDAAETLRLLARLWEVPEPAGEDPILASLGADVPVCYAGPSPMRMTGIGERLAPVPKLPDCALVLVNPKLPVETARVFESLERTSNPPMEEIPEGMDLTAFCEWLGRQRNDLHETAAAQVPAIDEALKKLRRQQLVRFATMSGSGATCVAVVKDMDHARRVARVLQVAEMSWWVAPAQLLS